MCEDPMFMMKTFISNQTSERKLKQREWYSPWISNNRFVLRGGLICRASKGDLLGYSLSMSAKRFR